MQIFSSHVLCSLLMFACGLALCLLWMFACSFSLQICSSHALGVLLVVLFNSLLHSPSHPPTQHISLPCADGGLVLESFQWFGSSCLA